MQQNNYIGPDAANIDACARGVAIYRQCVYSGSFLLVAAAAAANSEQSYMGSSQKKQKKEQQEKQAKDREKKRKKEATRRREGAVRMRPVAKYRVGERDRTGVHTQ